MADEPDGTDGTDKHGGNNSDSAPVNEKLRSRVWLGTYNNPQKGEGCSTAQLAQLLGLLKPSAWVFQLEQGDSGTPHYQCVVAVANPIVMPRWLCKDIHWVAGKGFKKLAEYCSKRQGRLAGPFSFNYDLPVEKPTLELRPWQKRIVNIVEGEVHDRLIYWFWEEDGGCGKTTLARYLCENYNCLYLDGKANDAKYAVASYVKKKKLKVAVFDYVRSKEEYISYEGLEAIKNGIFFNGKYEAGMVMYDIPHVIVFANFKPDEKKLSADRWSIRNIREMEMDIVSQVLANSKGMIL